MARVARTLFERLERSTAQRGVSASDSVDELRESIICNLERILNSRAGMSAACASYGIPDLTQIVSGIPERARDIEAALERCVREYEPRVTQVEVRHLMETKAPMTACFRIRAAVIAGKSAEEVWFDTVVVSSGRVRLV